MKKMKGIAGLAVTVLAASLALTVPAFADTYTSTGNGATVYFDGGGRVEYNARGGTLTFYDTYGSLVSTESVQMSEAEFKDLYYNPSSPVGASNASTYNNRYYGSEIDDAYWGASSTRYVAHWDADSQSKGKYTVTLYRDGHKVVTKTSKGGKSIDFTEAIGNANKAGDYYFVVKGSWGGGIVDEAESDYMYIDSAAINRIRNNKSSSSSSSSSVITNGAAGPGATPASQQGPAANNGWQQINGVWKYQKNPGIYAANGWELINGKWYYFDGAGNMAANQWVQTDAWYYVGPNGDMLVNEWIQSKGDPHIWYYVGGDGRMVTNTVVNGWPINGAGECYF